MFYGTVYSISCKTTRDIKMMQLDLFEKDITFELKTEIQKLKESNEKVRKSIFAKHGELFKNYINLLERMDIIERNICHGK